MLKVRENEDILAAAEEEMEEEYGYLSLKSETDALKEAVRQFMVTAAVDHAPVEGRGRFQMVRRFSRKWNPDKLRSIIGEKNFKKVTKRVVDSDKLDEFVRSGGYDQKQLEPAYEETPQKPFIRWYDETDSTSEEDALDKAMGE